MTEGLRVEPYFCESGNVYDSVEWELRDSKITDAEGKIIFEMKDVEVPKSWSQLATDILASKYCRKAGVPNERGHEWSLKQVIDRIVNAITTFGDNHGYFENHESAVNFMNELAWLLLHQHGAFNSPVWFNVGLWDMYKIKGTGENWAYDFSKSTGTIQDRIYKLNDRYYQPANQYERPQVSACFIQSVEDDLMSIFQLAKNEASIFKYGSGSGVNVSTLRGKNEKLSGGGKSSGLISFLKMLDSTTGVIKSGGTTRRAASLRALDADHPEILDFIDWKIKEEEKAKALIAQGYDSDFNGEAYQTISGQNSNNAVRFTDEFMEAVENDTDWKTINRTNGEVHEVHKARDIFEKLCEAAWKTADPGVQYHDTINKWNTCKKSGRINASNPCFAPGTLIPGYKKKDATFTFLKIEEIEPGDFVKSFDLKTNRYIYSEVLESGRTGVQVPVVKTFLDVGALGVDCMIHTSDHLFYCDGEEKFVTVDKKPLFINQDATWGFHVKVLKTIPFGVSDVYDIKVKDTHCFFTQYVLAHNCSEFMAHDDSACNLASLNLVKFWKDGKFDVESFRRAVRIFIIAQDILVDLGSYPTKEIAKNSHEFRPLGLGYSNLGSLLMLAGYPYDSDEGRTLAGLITSIMTGTAYETSAELAEHLGAFEKFEENKKSMHGVIEDHDLAQINLHEYVHEQRLWDFDFLGDEVTKIWRAIADNDYIEFRNAQTSLSAPCGTIGLLMDCDTTGIEPAFSLVSYKKLAGGGNLKMVNKTVEQALENLGYNDSIIAAILDQIKNTDSIEDAAMLIDHLSIFDCASKPVHGERFISSDGHIEMLAAVQPFLSGAISKTINIPNEATIEDVKDIFMKSWKLGLKAVTLYRDGCKASQPLTVKEEEKENTKIGEIKAESVKTEDFVVVSTNGRVKKEFKGLVIDDPLGTFLLKWGEKRRLPNFCTGERWRFRVGGVKLYLRTGNYEDGSLGEIWVDLDYKEGSTVRSLMNQYAIAISFCLQHGVPLKTLVDKFRYTKFEPSGIVSGIDDIKFATSVLDAVFAILETKYLKKENIQISDPMQDINDTADIIQKRTEMQHGQHPRENNKSMMSGQTPCSECSSTDFLKTGNCFVCLGCGTSQGCS
jgi:ribonucleotide reductase alpha subunit